MRKERAVVVVWRARVRGELTMSSIWDPRE
jgi:hypothetical protein